MSPAAPATPAERMSSPKRQKILSPTERISEALFGLIMVLSFTGSLSIATAGRSEVREMFVGAIGCNTAWGIVDAVMYLLGTLVERGRMLVTLRAARAADPAQGRAAIADAIPEELRAAFGAQHVEEARLALSRGPEPARRPTLNLGDARGAIGVFFLVFLSTFPVVLPFAFVADAHRALRLSNGVAVALLFLGGLGLGRYAGLRPLRTGLALVAVGAVLVAITIALGG